MHRGQPSHLLPDVSFPWAPVLPQDREHSASRPKGRGERSGRLSFGPTLSAADVVVTRRLSESMLVSGMSADHASSCCDNLGTRCRCGGIVGRGKRPVG